MIDDIKVSFKIILTNKFRSFITLFGIIVCISIFTIMISIFNISKQEFYKSMLKMGKNFIKINILNQDSRYYLGFEDILALKNSNLYVDSVSPEICSKGLIYNEFDRKGTYIIGGTEDYIDFMSMDLIHGRFFSKVDRVNKERVIVIDNVTSMSLFGTENSIGREVYILGGTSRKYTIIGVMRYPSNIWKKNKDITSFCIIPIDSYIENFKFTPLFDYLYISINGEEDAYKVSNSIIDFLKIRNNISKDVYKVEMFLRSENEMNYISGIFITLIKSMSYMCFILSGINVLNAMLYIVETRREEIFLRRLSGGNKLDIFIHFMVESIIFSLIGGVFGLILGCIFIYIINLIFNINLYMEFLWGFYVILISVLLGVLFGIIPSIRASTIPVLNSVNL